MSFLKGAGGDILGSISPAFGALSGKGIMGELMPILSPALGLFDLLKHHSHADASSSDGDTPTATPDGSTGLGRALGLNPNDVKTFGTAMNGVASAGGAASGYPTAPQGQAAPPVNNVMQLLDPNVLRSIYAQFGGGPSNTGYRQ